MQEIWEFLTGLFDAIFFDGSLEVPVDPDVQIIGAIDADGDNIFGGLLLAIDSDHDGITDHTGVAYNIDANHDGVIDAIRVDLRDTSLALNDPAQVVKFVNISRKLHN
ncbi:hypothetical protein [Nostoc sp. NMS8]|uniref:hypothetical protein n=1 Tax=Nostoc sp. NMS8 TaxID=2815392 RepID=UPI0025E43446|nr:hypothetical protein [Nostoc sp. NMS8]MBN3958733.1 hypothetical protein [Nostoc sp. NMS8]